MLSILVCSTLTTDIQQYNITVPFIHLVLGLPE